MQVFDQKVLQAKYADTRVKIDPYYIRRTGFIAPLTVLKLGDYNLSTVPAFMTFTDIQALAVLTPPEVSLFSRYTNVMNSLTLNFEQPEKSEPLRLHLKVTLVSIDPIPDRPNVCFIQLKVKNTPGELINITGSFLEELEHRRATYEKLAGEVITITPETTTSTGYKGFCELIFEGEKTKVQLVSFATKSARISGLENRETWIGRSPIFLKMPFGIAQPSVEIHLKAEDTSPTDAVAELPFNQELLEIIETYRFKTAMAARKKNGPGIPV